MGTAIKKYIVSLFAILVAGIVIYFLLCRYIPNLPSPVESEQRINGLIKTYEYSTYSALLSEIQNDKRVIYILIGTSSIMFLLLLFLLIRVMSNIDPGFLISPENYEVIQKQDMELFRKLKWKEELEQSKQTKTINSKPNKK